MRLLPAAAMAAVLIAGVSSAANAEVLKMPAQGTPATSPATSPTTSPATTHGFQVEMPVKGMTMGEVLKKFGAPQKKLAPVGDPPITRWIYSDYIVYFEYKYVIHSVMTRR